LILNEGFQEVKLAEIGPEGLREIQFRVGYLPKEKVAEAHLSAH